MKTTKFLALAILLISAGAFHAAQAQEHPKKAEHPTKTEHPAKAEHPTKTEHPTKAEHPSHAEHPTKTEHPGNAGDLISVASHTGEFKTFISAIEAAGLINKLQGKGPFTIFAPTDDAFAKLPAGMMEDLLKPANKAKLAGLLANHVVPGTIMAANVKTMKATNVSGQDLNIQVNDGMVTVDEARVVHADLAATNGVIHAIDMVIIPAPHGEHPASDKPKDHPAH